ncbi:MAG: class I SAM-dependent methyltransferase [Alphaproteobacteria bacterium]|nr:MAG: class I SAM-dependent methyltransferase [Alphaproteobacteria bacterium]
MRRPLLRLTPQKLMDQKLIIGASSRPRGANVRDRLAVLQELAPIRAKRLVDLGGGEGSYTLELVEAAPEAQVVLIDLSGSAVSVAKQRLREKCHSVEFLVSAGEALPVRDNAFDAGLLIEVLDHVDDPVATVQEAARVLAPGGVLYVTVPNRWFPFETHPLRVGRALVKPWVFPFLPWVAPLHRRMATARVFGTRDLDRLAAAAGLQVLGIRPLMPPLERLPRLRRVVRWLSHTPVRAFGVSLCAALQKPARKEPKLTQDGSA